MSLIIKKLARIETSKKEAERRGLQIETLDFFLTDKKTLIAIKFNSLVEDCVYSVIATFVEV